MQFVLTLFRQHYYRYSSKLTTLKLTYARDCTEPAYTAPGD